MRCAAATASRRRARLSLGLLGRRVGVQQRDLALGQREVLGQAVVDLGRQSQALALDLRARDALAQARGGDAGAEQVAEDGEHGRARLLERERVALRGGDHAEDVARRRPAAARATPRRAGRTGWPPASVAGSWKTSGAPAGEASRQASCSKRSSSARPTPSTSAPEAAKRRRIGHAVGLGQVERGDVAAERRRTSRRARARPARASVPGADERARHAADGGDRAAGWTAAARWRLMRPRLHRRDRLRVRWTTARSRVLVVDDHRLMREGTAALLRADERVEVAGLAARRARGAGPGRAPRSRRRRCSTSTCPARAGIETCAALRERASRTSRC